MKRNVSEAAVQREYRIMRMRYPGFCGCEQCEYDVITFVLNRVKPQYVSTERGEIITDVETHTHQSKAQVDVVLMEAFEKVSQSPRCQARRRPPG